MLAISLVNVQATRPIHPSTEGGKPAQLIGSVAQGEALLGLDEATPKANLTGVPEGEDARAETGRLPAAV